MHNAEERKKQILIVEDEGLIACDIQRRLERMGYSAPAIASGIMLRGEAAAATNSTGGDSANCSTQ